MPTLILGEGEEKNRREKEDKNIYRCNCLYKRRCHRFLCYHLLYSDPISLQTRY